MRVGKNLSGIVGIYIKTYGNTIFNLEGQESG